MADHSRNASDGGYQYPRGYQYPQTEYQLQNVNPNSGDWEPVVPKRYTPSPPRPPSVESENTLLKKRDPGVVSEEVEEIQGDPRGRRLPGELRRSSAIVLGEAVWKFFAVCCGIVFVAYGFIILSLHDKAPDPILRTALEAAAKYGPTIYPIVFTTVVGTSIKAIFSWRLERGDRLGTLNQLSGSMTLVSALTAVYKYRRWRLDVLSTILIALWILSPLGGQASLRVLEFRKNTYISPAAFAYYDVKKIGLWEAMLGSERGTAVVPINAMLTTSLCRKKNSTRDSRDNWGNVRIPMIELLSNRDKKDKDGWIDVDSLEHSSMIGIPVMGPAGAGEIANFAIETSYWTVDCKTSQYDFRNPMINTTFPNPEWLGFDASGSLALATRVTDQDSRMKMVAEMDPNMPPRELYFAARGGSEIITEALCPIKSTFVEANITCVKLDCRVSRMRLSTKPQPPENWTQLDSLVQLAPSVFANFAKFFTTAYAPGTSRGTNLLAAYFFHSTDPALPYQQTGGATVSIPSLMELKEDDFSLRLAQLLNSYYISGSANRYIANGYVAWKDENMVEEDRIEVDGIIGNEEEVVLCVKGWLFVLLFSGLLMAHMGLLGLIVPLFCRIPEIDLDVTNIIRESPYASLSAPGARPVRHYDSGMGWVHHRNTKIRIGDVHPDKDVGHITVGLEQYVARVGKKQTGRLYG